MTLRPKSGNILILLDENSLDAYIVSAVIERQREVNQSMKGSHIHYDQIFRVLKSKYPDLEVNQDTVVDRLRALTQKGVLTREPTAGDPNYGFNIKYLEGNNSKPKRGDDESILGEKSSEVNLSEITKHGLLDRKAYEKLKDLMEKNAISPAEMWVGLPSADTYAARLRRSRLVERIKDPNPRNRGFVYRVKSEHLPLVQNLIKTYEKGN